MVLSLLLKVVYAIVSECWVLFVRRHYDHCDNGGILNWRKIYTGHVIALSMVVRSVLSLQGSSGSFKPFKSCLFGVQL